MTTTPHQVADPVPEGAPLEESLSYLALVSPRSRLVAAAGLHARPVFLPAAPACASRLDAEPAVEPPAPATR